MSLFYLLSCFSIIVISVSVTSRILSFRHAAVVKQVNMFLYLMPMNFGDVINEKSYTIDWILFKQIAQYKILL